MRCTASSRFVIAVLSLALLPAMVAVAQTSDGIVPAREGTCDRLIGGTPALYGLCIAYCEAQDSDAADLRNPGAWKAAPSRSILDNYRSRMQPGDPDMPCLQPACPCWTEDELDEVFPSSLSSFQCATDDRTMTTSSDATILNSPDDSREERCVPFAYGHPIAYAADFSDEDIRSCYLNDPANDVLRFFLITPSEFELCKASLRNHADSLGAECIPLADITYGSGETCDLHD